jgi:hypothetical protein
MSGTDHSQRAEVRARLRALRDDLIRAGTVRPSSMRDWEIWHEVTAERFGLSETPDTATDEAPDGR